MPVRKLLDECDELYESGDFLKVLEKSGEILEADSSNLKALGFRAMSLLRLKDYGCALTYLNRILEMNDDAYFSNEKLEALLNLDRVDEAYKFYLNLGEEVIWKENQELLAHRLIDFNRFDEALEILSSLDEHNWLMNYEIIDGFKRIANKSGMDLHERYDKYYLSWIGSIKSKSDERLCPLCGGSYDNQFFFCENCAEEIMMPPYGLLIRCDDMKTYYYISDKLSRLKKHLNGPISLSELHAKMDYLDDREFYEFINRLSELDYLIVEDGKVDMFSDNTVLGEKYVLHIPLFRFSNDELIPIEIDGALDDLIESLDAESLYITKAKAHYKSRKYDELLVSVFTSSCGLDKAFTEWFVKNNGLLGQEALAYEHNGRLHIKDL